MQSSSCLLVQSTVLRTAAACMRTVLCALSFSSQRCMNGAMEEAQCPGMSNQHISDPPTDRREWRTRVEKRGLIPNLPLLSLFRSLRTEEKEEEEAVSTNPFFSFPSLPPPPFATQTIGIRGTCLLLRWIHQKKTKKHIILLTHFEKNR